MIVIIHLIYIVQPNDNYQLTDITIMATVYLKSLG